MRSPPPRFLAGGSIASGEVVRLTDEEARHVRVRRLRDGEPVAILDGSGTIGFGPLTRGGTAVRVELVESGAGEPGAAWTVAVAGAEIVRVEWAVEKGTECGAAAFLVYAASRSQASHLRALSARLPRLGRIAAEAAKQCGRSVIPPVSGPWPFESLLSRGRCVAAVPGAPPLASGDERIPPGGVLVIGPEGGLTEKEITSLSDSGAVLFGLGPRTLRLETAVVAALTRLLGAFG